jgi:hypothetical protein
MNAGAADAARASRAGTAASRIAEGGSVALGGIAIVLALLANHDWLDRHLLPQMFMPRARQVLVWSIERGVAIALGLLLIFPARRRVGSAVRAGQGADLAMSALLFAATLALALLASEAVLRTANWERLERWAAEEEPLRHAEPVLGWVDIPNRIGFETYDGRVIRYDLDAEGRRVRDLHRALDPARPSILFAGESMLFGFRLNWNETAAAQIGAARGLQTVNLSVNGYGTDQEWLQVRRALPHFRRTKAVVALFAPMMIERSLDRHRPRLDADLRWHAAEPGWRLGKLLRKLMLYHSARRIESGIAATRASLVAIVGAARAHGAQPLILVPEFGPEQPIERRLRKQVLAGLPYVRVELDPDWAIPRDGHPDARANVAIRQAVLAALKPEERS